MQSGYVVNVTTDESGAVTSDIQSPDALKNMSVICNTDGTFAKCGDVQVECSDGYYPFAELYKILVSVKNSEHVLKTKNKDSCVFEYKNGNKK